MFPSREELQLRHCVPTGQLNLIAGTQQHPAINVALAIAKEIDHEELNRTQSQD
jgi:hypothetical protein